MPINVYGNVGPGDKSRYLRDVNYDYDYPEGLDLKPQSDLHEKLKREVLQRAQEAQSVIRRRFDQWKKIDQNLTAYVPLDAVEQGIKTADDRKPVRIVIPASYATLETLLTYFYAAFIQDPVFKFQGTGPEDTLGAIMLEHVIQNQVIKGKMALDMHTAWRDGFAYGIGVVSPVWTKRTGFQTRFSENSMISPLTGMLVKMGFLSEKKRVTLYEGHRLYSIDPYLLLPDPNVSIHNVQDSEYFGWVERTNFTSLMSKERDSDGQIFNVKYLSEMTGMAGRSIYYEAADNGREQKWGGVTNSSFANVSPSTRPIDVVWMYLSIIPSEYGLGDSEYPEKWLFAVAADAVIIQAQPLGLDHDMIPVAVCAPDFDGHSSTPVSRIEITYGLQEAIDFMHTSHVSNVRKAVNDMLIIDPEILNINDLTDPKAGMLVRVRRRFWGQGKLRDAYAQLTVNDITRQNTTDASLYMDIMQRVTGAVDILQGVPRKGGERVSATEASATRTGALSRLEKSSRVVGFQFHYDLAYLLASQTRQLMSQSTYMKVAGRWEEKLRSDYGVAEGIEISPDKLDVEYDIIPSDGTIPGSGDSALMTQLLNIASANPILGQSLDLPRVFMATARMLGAKNIDDFVKKQEMMQPQVMPDQEVEDQVQAGNLIPVNAGGGNGTQGPIIG